MCRAPSSPIRKAIVLHCEMSVNRFAVNLLPAVTGARIHTRCNQKQRPFRITLCRLKWSRRNFSFPKVLLSPVYFVCCGDSFTTRSDGSERLRTFRASSSSMSGAMLGPPNAVTRVSHVARVASTVAKSSCALVNCERSADCASSPRVPWSAFQPKYQVIAKNIIGGTMAKRRRLISRSKLRALNQRSQLPVAYRVSPNGGNFARALSGANS